MPQMPIPGCAPALATRTIQRVCRCWLAHSVDISTINERYVFSNYIPLRDYMGEFIHLGIISMVCVLKTSSNDDRTQTAMMSRSEVSWAWSLLCRDSNHGCFCLRGMFCLRFVRKWRETSQSERFESMKNIIVQSYRSYNNKRNLVVLLLKIKK